jgi:hypothetical protein
LRQTLPMMGWEAELNAVGFYERMGGRYLREQMGDWGRSLPVMGIDLVDPVRNQRFARWAFRQVAVGSAQAPVLVPGAGRAQQRVRPELGQRLEHARGVPAPDPLRRGGARRLQRRGLAPASTQPADDPPERLLRADRPRPCYRRDPARARRLLHEIPDRDDRRNGNARRPAGDRSGPAAAAVATARVGGHHMPVHSAVCRSDDPTSVGGGARVRTPSLETWPSPPTTTSSSSRQTG